MSQRDDGEEKKERTRVAERDLTLATPEEAAALSSLRERLPLILSDHPGFPEGGIDDNDLMRYVRARSCNVDKAEAMLRETVRWSVDFRPWAIGSAHGEDVRDNDPERPLARVAAQAETGKLHLYCNDLDGRPVLLMRPRFETSKCKEWRLRHFVHWMSTAVEDAKDHGMDKMVWIIDQSGGSGGITDASTGKATLSVLQNHFPERLKKAFIVHGSWAFWAFWKVLSPFLDPVTKDKVQFLSNDKAKMREELSAYIDPAQLHVDYGGDRTDEYVHDKWFPGYPVVGGDTDAFAKRIAAEVAARKEKREAQQDGVAQGEVQEGQK